jgi:hypothetical protein
MELIIKSYQATGWLCPITGEDFKRVEEYCKDNDEDIENLCPSASEDIFQEIIDGFDVYEWALNGEDLSLFYTRIIGEFEIYYIKDGKEVNLPLSECTVNKSKVNENDLKDHFGDDKGIAYSFGYSSDEIMEVRLNIEDSSDFNPKKLAISIVENELFDVGPFIEDIEYNNECILDDLDDVEGEYYNTLSYEL